MKGLCGCYIPLIARRDVDLRNSAIHGTRAHDLHGSTTHAWCAACSPQSAKSIEQAMLTRHRAARES